MGIRPELLSGMKSILAKADPAITALMVDGNTVWVCCADVNKVEEMGFVLEELSELFGIDDEKCCFSPMMDNSYMKEFGEYYVER